MAGPLTIQKVPKGALGLLAMKGSGQLPADLAPNVQGTVALDPGYLMQDWREAYLVTPNATTNNTNYVGLPLVPEGEMWMVKQIGIFCPLVGAGAGWWMPAVRRATSTTRVQVIGTQVNWTAGDRSAWGRTFLDYELIALPNDGFCLYNIQGNFVTPVDIVVNYYRIPI